MSSDAYDAFAVGKKERLCVEESVPQRVSVCERKIRVHLVNKDD